MKKIKNGPCGKATKGDLLNVELGLRLDRSPRDTTSPATEEAHMVLIAREHLSGLYDRQHLWPVPAVAALFYPAALFALYRSFDLYRDATQMSDRLLSVV